MHVQHFSKIYEYVIVEVYVVVSEKKSFTEYDHAMYTSPNTCILNGKSAKYYMVYIISNARR